MNNATTIINRMSVKERKDGRYEGRITVNGIRKSFYGKTKTEVKQDAKSYFKMIESGYKEPQKIILNEYIEHWLKTYKLGKIEPSSYCRLYSVYEHQILNSHIGKKKIGEITMEDIQKLIDEHASPTTDKTKALAASGLKRLIHLLRPCFERAKNSGVIDVNPCGDIQLPKARYIKIKTKKQYSLSDAEIQQFKESALSTYKTTGEYRSRDAFILLLMLSLGLRVGEALALEWDDINFGTNLVHIHRTIQSDVKETGLDGKSMRCNLLKDSTKTIGGERFLKLNDSVLGYIRELKEYDKRNGIQSPYVACTGVGTRNSGRNLQRSLTRLVSRIDIEQCVTLHTLRHTFGSTLIRRGVGIETVSKLMGHSKITITYDKYIHVMKEQQAMAMDMVEIC